jgi:hypothetical protein
MNITLENRRFELANLNESIDIGVKIRQENTKVEIIINFLSKLV